jgi:rhodanese-related sulfurtransferase
MNYETILPVELSARMKRGERVTLIDVREQMEYQIARIEGASLLPLSRFEEWAGRLNPEEEIIVMCHHGIRSAHVCSVLARQGFKKMVNLAGGIDRWSTDVDSSVAVY